MLTRSTTAHPARRHFPVAEGLEPRTLLSVQPLGPEVRANTTTAGDQQTLTEHKAVASNAAGDFVVIWETTQLGPSGQLFGQRFNAAGVKQGGEFWITLPTHSGQYYPSVAMDAAGGFVVVWNNQSAVFRGIYSRRYGRDGAPQGSVTQVSTSGSDPDVALDADGDYVVTWAQLGSTWDVLAQRFDAAGAALGGPFFAHADGSDTQVDPAVASDADGNFVITWIGVNPIAPVKRIQGRLFDSAGNPRTGDLDLVPGTPTPVRWGQHRVAMDADGDFTIVWDALNWAPDSDGYGVYGRRFSRAGAPLGGQFLANTTTAGTQNRPDISTDAAGDFVVSWETINGMTAQYFDPAGARVGGEFVLNTAASRGAWLASVAMDYDGDFVAAWQSSVSGDDDVYARRFANTRNLPNTAAGQVFLDSNLNGARDAGETGLPGWQVYHDANNNGQLDTSALAHPSRAVLVPLRPVSTRRSLGAAAGFGAGQVITDVNVTINIQHPTDGDLTATLVSPSGRRAELFSHVGGTGDNFTNTTLDDAAPVPINALGAPFTGTFRTQNQTLSAFNGEVLGDDGFWMLEVQNSGGDSGFIFSWVVTVTSAENSVASDAAGNYSLSLPPGPGTRVVREAPRRLWVQTFPPGGAQSATFGDGGQTAGGLDFGNAYAGTVSGAVFEDVNADGVRDEEPLLAGWRVYADLNENGQFDSTEPSAISAADAGYLLRGVPAGTPVTLGSLPPQTTGWQLSHAPGPVTLSVRDPQVSGQDFGFVRRSAPRVTQVYVRGPGMLSNAAFRGAGGIDPMYGYPVPAGAAQLRAIPWVNGIDTIALRFSEDAYALIGQDDLVIRDSAHRLDVGARIIDSNTHTLTWLLNTPVTQGKLRLFLDDARVPAIDGEWNNGADAYPSGDGNAGGDFNFRINVLRGDVTGDLQVNALDLADVRRRLGRRPGDGTSGAGAYSIFNDVTMDGVINALDLAATRQRLGSRIGNLPEPA